MVKEQPMCMSFIDQEKKETQNTSENGYSKYNPMENCITSGT